VALYELDDPGPLRRPALIVGLDGWVDAGSAATTAAGLIAAGAEVVATFDADKLFDYRARRPTLDIEDGRLHELTWPEFRIRLSRRDERDLLVLTGPEPDYRWPRLAIAVIDAATSLGVTEWISIGAIPAAVPHTRAVPILGTASEPGLLRGNIRPGPQGMLRVPAALVSVLEEWEEAKGRLLRLGHEPSSDVGRDLAAIACVRAEQVEGRLCVVEAPRSEMIEGVGIDIDDHPVPGPGGDLRSGSVEVTPHLR